MLDEASILWQSDCNIWSTVTNTIYKCVIVKVSNVDRKYLSSEIDDVSLMFFRFVFLMRRRCFLTLSFNFQRYKYRRKLFKTFWTILTPVPATPVLAMWPLKRDGCWFVTLNVIFTSLCNIVMFHFVVSRYFYFEKYLIFKTLTSPFRNPFVSMGVPSSLVLLKHLLSLGVILMIYLVLSNFTTLTTDLITNKVSHTNTIVLFSNVSLGPSSVGNQHIDLDLITVILTLSSKIGD